MNSNAARPLEGLRVLSLAEQYPGPLATLLLADLGADVILVERPGLGDPARRYEGHFAALSRNKRSVVLDLKSESGKADFRALIDTADALVEGFRPGVMDRLGFGPEAMARYRPQMVYVSISSFGQFGPFAGIAGHDISVQGVAGMMDVRVGEEAGYEVPVLPVADIASGMFGALGVVTMLLARFRGRPVAPVDVSMLDALAFWMAPLSLPRANGTMAAPFPPTEPAYGLFRSSDDRQFTLSIAGEDHMWRALCDLLGMPDLADLAESERKARRDQIQPRIRAAIEARDWVWIEREFTASGIAFGPVIAMTEVATDPRLAERGLFFDLVNGRGVSERHARQPMLIGGVTAQPSRAVPQLGQHNDELIPPASAKMPRAYRSAT